MVDVQVFVLGVDTIYYSCIYAKTVAFYMHSQKRKKVLH